MTDKALALLADIRSVLKDGPSEIDCAILVARIDLLAATPDAASVTPDAGEIGPTMATFDCYRCYKEERQRLLDAGESIEPIFRAMQLCTVCGNKRCPKATDHRLDCTGSNEPGQDGSMYVW
jgi:hypothetical protein